MGFSIVTYYVSENVFVDDSKDVGKLKYQAYQCLGIAEGYFLMIMMRDLFASFIQLRTDHPMALWEAMTLHVVGLPIDSMVIMILSGYGYIVYQSIVRNECDMSLSKCSIEGKFDPILNTDLYIGFIFTVLNVCVKFMLILAFHFYYGGFASLEVEIYGGDNLRMYATGNNLHNHRGGGANNIRNTSVTLL